MKKFYYIYKITNLINQKIYIGAHSTADLNDGYMGSGQLICRAITKHGKENFKKEILFYCDTRDEMYSMESVIVNESFVHSAETYNMRVGGLGGCPLSYEKLKHHNLVEFEKRLEIYYSNPKLCLGCNLPIDYKKRSNTAFCSRSCSAKATNNFSHSNKRKNSIPIRIKQEKISLKTKYDMHPAFCKQCNVCLDFSKRRNTFCTRSCKAIFTNSHRYK